MTVWGDVSKSPGAWMMAPFILATEEKVMNQSDMVALGRPGVGEQAMRDHGFEPDERIEIDFTFEYPDPETYARGIAATGPAFEAMQNVGEKGFIDAAIEGATPHVRAGLPLRDHIQLFCYVGVKQ